MRMAWWLLLLAAFVPGCAEARDLDLTITHYESRTRWDQDTSTTTCTHGHWFTLSIRNDTGQTIGVQEDRWEATWPTTTWGATVSEGPATASPDATIERKLGFCALGGETARPDRLRLYDRDYREDGARILAAVDVPTT